MWPKAYRDYPEDTPLKKETVSPSNGIIGCEMHDSNGWGDSYHQPRKREHGILYAFLTWIFGHNEEGKS